MLMKLFDDERYPKFAVHHQQNCKTEEHRSNHYHIEERKKTDENVSSKYPENNIGLKG
jgi:hypothetical protein